MEINTEYSLEGLMLKLKLQYIGHPMQRANSTGKILMLEKIEGKWWRGWQRMRWFDNITDLMNTNLSKSARYWRTGKAGMLQSMRSQNVEYDLVTKQQK